MIHRRNVETPISSFKYRILRAFEVMKAADGLAFWVALNASPN